MSGFYFFSDHLLCRAWSPHPFWFLFFWLFSMWLSFVKWFSNFVWSFSLLIRNPRLKSRKNADLRLQSTHGQGKRKEKEFQPCCNFFFLFSLFFLLFFLIVKTIIWILPWQICATNERDQNEKQNCRSLTKKSFFEHRAFLPVISRTKKGIFASIFCCEQKSYRKYSQLEISVKQQKTSSDICRKSRPINRINTWILPSN